MNMMKTISAALLILICIGCSQQVTQHDCCKAQAQADTWIHLFNGKDLTGWATEGNAKWTVEEGQLVGTQGENAAPGDLLTNDDYSDFTLVVTYRVEWPANTGVWFRYQSPKQAYQADILEYKKPLAYSGTLYCPGKMFLAANTDPTIENRDGWNTMKIKADGDHLQIWLNGQKTADVRDTTTSTGRIGFQVHAGNQFNKMKIIVREVKIRLPQ